MLESINFAPIKNLSLFCFHVDIFPRACMDEKPKEFLLTGPARRAEILFQAAELSINGTLPRGSLKKVAGAVGCHPTTVRRTWESKTTSISVVKRIMHSNLGNINRQKHDPQTIKAQILQLPPRYQKNLKSMSQHT